MSAEFIRKLLVLAERVLQPNTQDGFCLALANAQAEVLDWSAPQLLDMLNPPAIDKAFEVCKHHQRMRRVLEAILWPAQEKAASRSPHDEIHSTFVLPISARFEEAPTERAVWVPDCLHLFNETLMSLELSGCLATQADVGGVAALYRREDIASFGPHNLAGALRERARGLDCDIPAPLPFYFDEDFPAARDVTFYLLFSASNRGSSPYEQKPLMSHVKAGIAEAFEHEMSNYDLRVSQIEPQKPAPLWTTSAYTFGAGGRDLSAKVRALADLAGPQGSLVGQSPAPGWVELSIRDANGNLRPGLPPFSVLEPEDVILDLVGSLAGRLGCRLERASDWPVVRGHALLH